MPERLVRDNLIGMVASFIVWSAYFAAVYSFQAIACIRGFQGARVAGVDMLTLGLVIMTALTLVAIAYLGWRSLRVVSLSRVVQGDAPDVSCADFMALTSALLAAMALVATLWVALPILLLPPCA